MEWAAVVLAVMIGFFIWSNISTARALNRRMQSSVDDFFETLAAAISAGHTQRAFEEIADSFRRAIERIANLFRWK